jgi:hypothetical protein
MPDGVERQDGGEPKVRAYLRKDHPTLAARSLDE